MIALRHSPMDTGKKKYVSAWGLLGLLFPVTLVLIGRFGHGLGADIPSFVTAPMVPLIFVAYALALAVTDAGGNSAALLPTLTISALVLLLNAAFYAGLGWLSWPIAKKLRGRG